MLRITEGLKRNGLLNEKGLPKSILHLGIMFEMGESYLAGMPLWLQRAIFGPLAALTQDRSRSRCISDAAARRARAEWGERHADRIKRCSICLAVSTWGPGVEPPAESSHGRHRRSPLARAGRGAAVKHYARCYRHCENPGHLGRSEAPTPPRRSGNRYAQRTGAGVCDAHPAHYLLTWSSLSSRGQTNIKNDRGGEFPRRLGHLAGLQGFEPQLPDSESGVLPLDDSPTSGNKYTHSGRVMQPHRNEAVAHPAGCRACQSVRA